MTREYDWRSAVERDAALVPALLEQTLQYALANDGGINPPADGRNQPGEVDPRVFRALAGAMRAAGWEPELAEIDPDDPDHLGITSIAASSVPGWYADWKVTEVPVIKTTVTVTTGLSPVSTLRVGLHEFGHALKKSELTVDEISFVGFMRMLFGEDGAEEAEVQMAADAILDRLGYEPSEYGPSYIGLQLHREPDDELKDKAAGTAATIWDALVSAHEEAQLSTAGQ